MMRRFLVGGLMLLALGAGARGDDKPEGAGHPPRPGA